MSEMVDAVAVAIFKALAGEPNCLISRVGADKAAKAAIEALREPDDAMQQEGRYAIGGEPDSNADTERAAADCWRAMITAALNPDRTL